MNFCFLTDQICFVFRSFIEYSAHTEGNGSFSLQVSMNVFWDYNFIYLLYLVCRAKKTSKVVWDNWVNHDYYHYIHHCYNWCCCVRIKISAEEKVCTHPFLLILLRYYNSSSPFSKIKFDTFLKLNISVREWLNHWRSGILFLVIAQNSVKDADRKNGDSTFFKINFMKSNWDIPKNLQGSPIYYCQAQLKLQLQLN